MKKYIIVSIIVAALFVGGSIMVAKAVREVAKPPVQKAQTLTITAFVTALADALKFNYNSNLGNVTKYELENMLKNVIVNLQTGGTPGPVSLPPACFPGNAGYGTSHVCYAVECHDAGCAGNSTSVDTSNACIGCPSS